MALELDDTARPLLQQQHGPDKGVGILLVSGYGLDSEGLTVEWCCSATAEHDAGLAFLGSYDDVPFYAHPRLVAYLRWHTLRLRASRFPWGRGLIVERDAEMLRALTFWERTHPAQRSDARGDIGHC